jgi:hypothetical protein
MGTQTMARTPSLTPQEAESLIGKRGHIAVNSENRPLIRKWVVSQGYPALFVAGLSMRELALAYNQTDGSGLAAIKRKLDELENGDENDDAPQPAPIPTPYLRDDPRAAPQEAAEPAAEPETPQEAAEPAADQPEPMAAPMAPQPAPNAAAQPIPGNAIPANVDPMALLRQLLLQGWTPGLDENRVRAIINESLAGVAPRVIEVRHQDKKPIRIEGIVHPQFERALSYLSKIGPNGYQANIMLVGPAGCGKTHLIKQLAKALDVDHTIVGGTAGASEGDLIGRLLPGDGGKFEYHPSKAIKLYEQGKALIGFDEIDGFDPNMLMVANMPLANGSWFVHLRKDNPEVLRGANTYFMATANTYGTGANPIYAGRNAMDGATRDRFIFITVDYDRTLEESIAAAGGLTAAEMAGLWELRDRAREAQLRRVISTRSFQKAAIMKQSGESWREIRDHLLEDWTKDEKAKVGV